MTKRKIVVEIDCGDRWCNNCSMDRNGYCHALQQRQKRDFIGDTMRTRKCIAAEQEAKG
jgi:hypothetical protein